jgi:ubiquitin-protein ligase
MSNLAIARLQKEVTMLQKDPPPNAWCGPIEGKPLTELEAGIQGPTGTVYEAGVFKLSVHIPTR